MDGDYRVLGFASLGSFIVPFTCSGVYSQEFALHCVSDPGLRHECRCPLGSEKAEKHWHTIFRAGNSPCSIFFDLDFHVFECFFEIYHFMHMRVLHTCMSVCFLYPVPAEARRGIRSPGTGVADSCEFP